MEEIKKLLNQPAFTVGNLANLKLSDNLPDGRISVEFPGGVIDSFFIRNNVSPYLVILLSGARDPRRQPLPKFDRWSWGGKFDASILCISDPTLALDDKNLNIGWYLGTEQNDYMSHIAIWVEHVANYLGIALEKVITYGSSAGGFASLMLTARLKRSVAVAINPQLDVFKYYQKFVDQYFDIAFSTDKGSLSSSVKARFLAMPAIQSSPVARFIIAQNIQDKFHYVKHYIPFCKSLDIPNSNNIMNILRCKNVSTILFDSPNGHGSEPDEIVPILMSEAKRV